MILLGRRRTDHMQSNQSGLRLDSARLARGNKDDRARMDSLLHVACDDLPVALQDEQSHINAGPVDWDESSQFQAGKHHLHMCTGCHEDRVEPLRPEGDRVAIGTENCRHALILRTRPTDHSDSDHRNRGAAAR